MHKNLRVALLLDSLYVDGWEYVMIEKIQASRMAEVVLVIHIKNSQSGDQNDRPNTFFDLYRNLDDRLFSSIRRVDAFSKKGIDPLVEKAAVITLNANFSEDGASLHEEDVGTIRDYDLDVVVRCGTDRWRGDILTAARCGVWGYEHADLVTHRGGVGGYWETFVNHPVTGASLTLLTAEEDPVVLYQSFSATHLLSPSVGRSHNYMKSALFVVRTLRQVHTLGTASFLEKIRVEKNVPRFYSHRHYQTPGNLTTLWFTALQAGKLIKKSLLRMFNFDQWFLLYQLKPGKIATAFWQFKKLVPPKDRFWADPHLLFRNDRYYIFIEELLYSTNKGHISVIEMDRLGNIKQPVKVLEKNHHLSYPFVFEWEGQTYMIPETMEGGAIELYRCAEFPGKWEFVMNLMSHVRAVDTTLLFQDGKWWMFTTIVEVEGLKPWDELYVFYADTFLTDQWTPHPLNPVISDVRTARPAGRLFRYNDILYRPSQNCSPIYGYGFQLNRVEVLTETDYQEETVTVAEPHWEKAVEGTHSFCYEKDLTIIDGFWWRSKLG